MPPELILFQTRLSGKTSLALLGYEQDGELNHQISMLSEFGLLPLGWIYVCDQSVHWARNKKGRILRNEIMT